MKITDTANRILSIKQKLGERLLILTHHYQRDEVVQFGDFRGDSLMLARKSAESNAEYIVFCGVHFMAESSAILTKGYQKVYLPAMDAGCPMADMADIEALEQAWNELRELDVEAMPVLYVNSSADTKAFCGRHNGSVCTSSNAESIIRWSFNQSDTVFFIPDEHLGRNSCNRIGMPSSDIIVWNPALPFGGNSADDIRSAKMILWKGFCHVHTHFTTGHISRARQKYPDARIIVHPESLEQVVNLADANGSTSFIENFVTASGPGSTTIIGTELNMVSRLAKENIDKTILPLSRSLCPNMFKTDMQQLLHTLENLDSGNQIIVPDAIKKDARLPLERMLFIQGTKPASTENHKISAL